jgi:hypothetical protein
LTGRAAGFDLTAFWANRGLAIAVESRRAAARLRIMAISEKKMRLERLKEPRMTSRTGAVHPHWPKPYHMAKKRVSMGLLCR